MIVPFADLLADAGGAVGAFTAYNFEQAAGILRAAEEHEAGVIVLVSAQSFAARDGEGFTAALAALCDRARARACVQLDHTSDLAAIERAVELGVGAVMADGSKLPYEENIAFSRAAAEVAPHVETELGALEGDEDVAAAVAAGALTDPDEAADFVARTGAACLAVSIGNVHGRYTRPPQLDWDRLQTIRERVAVPLSLHGASGLPDDTVRRAVALGVKKVNVNTELRDAYLAETETRLLEVREGARLLALNEAQAEATARVVAEKLRMFAG